jgi:hypothetical protein
MTSVKFVLIVFGLLQNPMPQVFDTQALCDQAANKIVAHARRNEYVTYTCQQIEVGKEI